MTIISDSSKKTLAKIRPREIARDVIPSTLVRRGFPVHESKRWQADDYAMLMLADLQKALAYCRDHNLPIFILVLGGSGKGKTGLVLQLAKLLTEANGHEWAVEKFYRLDTTSQLTGAVIAKDYTRGQFVIQDEFHLNAPKYATSILQLQDVNQFLNTVRSEGIGFIGLSQYLRDLDMSVLDKFGFRIHAIGVDHKRRTIRARVEIKLQEIGGDWSVSWFPYQELLVQFGSERDYLLVEEMKRKATRTEETETRSYHGVKKERLAAIKGKKLLIIADLLKEGRVDDDPEYSLSAEEVAAYTMFFYEDIISSVTGVLGQTSSAKMIRTSFLKTMRATHQSANPQIVPRAVLKLITKVNKVIL